MINYQNLADSNTYYTDKGYTRIEAPWWVSEDIMNITKPDGHLYYIPTNQKCLVASGEQSFLYMANKGRLPSGKYQTITPCFRNESIGRLHKKCFIKNELIITDIKIDSLSTIIADAFFFFKNKIEQEKLPLDLLQVTVDGEIMPLDYIEIAKPSIIYDITYDGVEIGSYGYRECEFLKWVFGTGCAEPRLSRALHRVRMKHAKH